MTDLETGRRLSADDQSSVDMTVSAEIERLRAEGVETDGDKVALVYTICQRPRLSIREQNDLLARVLGLDKRQVADVFSTGIPDESRDRLNATAAYAAMLLRKTGYDYGKLDTILVTPNPSLRKASHFRFSPPRTPIRCMVEGDINLVILAAANSSET